MPTITNYHYRGDVQWLSGGRPSGGEGLTQNLYPFVAGRGGGKVSLVVSVDSDGREQLAYTFEGAQKVTYWTDGTDALLQGGQFPTLYATFLALPTYPCVGFLEPSLLRRHDQQGSRSPFGEPCSPKVANCSAVVAPFANEQAFRYQLTGTPTRPTEVAVQMHGDPLLQWTFTWGEASMPTRVAFRELTVQHSPAATANYVFDHSDSSPGDLSLEHVLKDGQRLSVDKDGTVLGLTYRPGQDIWKRYDDQLQTATRVQSQQSQRPSQGPLAGILVGAGFIAVIAGIVWTRRK